MIVPVALLASMLNALEMVEGMIEKAEVAPIAPAVNFRKRRLGIGRCGDCFLTTNRNISLQGLLWQEEEAFLAGQTHLNRCKPLEITDAKLNLTRSPASGERARPRVQRAAPSQPASSSPLQFRCVRPGFSAISSRHPQPVHHRRRAAALHASKAVNYVFLARRRYRSRRCSKLPGFSR